MREPGLGCIAIGKPKPLGGPFPVWLFFICVIQKHAQDKGCTELDDALHLHGTVHAKTAKRNFHVKFGAPWSCADQKVKVLNWNSELNSGLFFNFLWLLVFLFFPPSKILISISNLLFLIVQFSSYLIAFRDIWDFICKICLYKSVFKFPLCYVLTLGPPAMFNH